MYWQQVPSGYGKVGFSPAFFVFVAPFLFPSSPPFPVA
jgi:hypothetical protein